MAIEIIAVEVEAVQMVPQKIVQNAIVFALVGAHFVVVAGTASDRLDGPDHVVGRVLRYLNPTL